jgi:hypothetical protein
MKQKIEIEVDVPDGYELIGFGHPQVGEYGLDIDDYKPYGPFNKYDINPICSTFDNTIRLKKKPQYKWPDFIKSGTYLCMNQSGEWWISTCLPSLTYCGWTTDFGYMIKTINFNMSNPETPSDWTKSLIRKP